MEKIGVLILGGPFKKDELEKGFNTAFPEYKNVKFYDTKDNFNPQEIYLIIGYKITKELLDKFPNLKLVHVPFAGIDILNLDIVREKNIPVSNSHTNAKAVAEFAVSLYFSLVKEIPLLDKYMRKGIWKGRWEKTTLDDIYGRTITILGFGAIGKEIAHMLRPFGVKLYAVKRNIKPEDKLSFLEDIGNTKRIIEFLEKSDSLIISLPLTKETENIIGEKELNALGRGYLVNISRGKIINEAILFKYLQDNKLKGVALDVWWKYPKRENPETYPSQFPFWELENVIMTPHTAGVTPNFLSKAKEETVRIIKKIATGELPNENLVNLDLGY